MDSLEHERYVERAVRALEEIAERLGRIVELEEARAGARKSLDEVCDPSEHETVEGLLACPVCGPEARARTLADFELEDGEVLVEVKLEEEKEPPGH